MSEPATLAQVVETSKAVRDTPARLEKRARMRELFARLSPTDLRLAASFLAGEMPQGSLQIGWRALVAAERALARPTVLPLFAAVADVEKPPAPRSPTLAEVNGAFDALRQVTGSGAGRRRQGILERLFAPLSAGERTFIRDLILGELRQGALRAVVVEAVADAQAVEADTVRRAVMFAGSLGAVLETIAQHGPEALVHFGPRAGVPVEPMLATQAEDLETALAKFGGSAAAEWKLDGVRVQVHRQGNRVQTFSRRLRDVTALVPEAVAVGQGLRVKSVVLDGELIGLDARGRPAEFQELMARFARAKKAPPGPGREARDAAPTVELLATASPASPGAAKVPVRLVLVFFDVLEHDGEPVVERPYAERRKLLEALLPAAHRVPQRVVRDVDAARAMLEESLQAGHEGLVLKQLDAPYTAGRRGAAWCKVKPSVTLDLVILAAEWGHGRRQGWLSNLHLGARDESDPEHFFHLGKTFKGLTDQMLRELTADLLQIETRRDGHVVRVRPVRVVEVAFDEVQRSPRYDSGFALRFARVKRFRPDKSAVEANTLDDVRAIHAAQG